MRSAERYMGHGKGCSLQSHIICCRAVHPLSAFLAHSNLLLDLAACIHGLPFTRRCCRTLWFISIYNLIFMAPIALRPVALTKLRS